MKARLVMVVLETAGESCDVVSVLATALEELFPAAPAGVLCDEAGEEAEG